MSVVYAATGLFRKVVYSEGIDVSHWQGTIDFARVKAAGKKFVIAKASEGIGWTDPNYATYKQNALANGLAFTAYHFARPGSNDPVVEADWFVSVAGMQHGMLIPGLDLETNGGLGTTALQSWVAAWLGEVYAKLGTRPMIYTSPSFWSTDMGNTSWEASNGYRVLWIAHWNVAAPTVPAANWGGHSWTFWQYTDCGAVSGISGCVDLDRYRFLTFSGVTS